MLDWYYGWYSLWKSTAGDWHMISSRSLAALAHVVRDYFCSFLMNPLLSLFEFHYDYIITLVSTWPLVQVPGSMIILGQAF